MILILNPRQFYNMAGKCRLLAVGFSLEIQQPGAAGMRRDALASRGMERNGVSKHDDDIHEALSSLGKTPFAHTTRC